MCAVVVGNLGDKIKSLNPGWCGSVGWVLACEPKDHWFSSWPGHMPGLQAKSLVGGVQKATNPLHIEVSLPSFLPPFPLCKQ